jgi:hypothetical protein
LLSRSFGGIDIVGEILQFCNGLFGILDGFELEWTSRGIQKMDVWEASELADGLFEMMIYAAQA